MTQRLHLTIGEVLSLLREEFPDISISKIRFLESQGLVDPERTPSGYRKFYDHDVDRLRWILRQQREHFLPLKVIRGRLTGQEGDMSDPDLVTAVAEEVVIAYVDPTGSDGVIVIEDTIFLDEPAAGSAAAASPAPGPDTAPPPPDPAGTARAFHRADTVGDADGAVTTAVDEPVAGGSVVDESVVGTSVVGTSVAGESAGAGDGGADGDSGPERLFASPATASGAGSRSAGPRPAAPRSPAAKSPASKSAASRAAASKSSAARSGGATSSDSPAAEAAAAEAAAAESAAAEAAAAESAATDSPTESPTEAVSGAAAQGGAAPSPEAGPGASAPQQDVFTVAELAEAAGCTPQLIRDLQQFGILVAASEVNGKLYFDPGAVALARVGARFDDLGVEPRHLRTWRNAADREAGLFEQLVMPLLRQRNPQSRRQAAERLDELSDLGGQLRAGLLAEAVRQIK